jgi:hypothetical protein
MKTATLHPKALETLKVMDNILLSDLNKPRKNNPCKKEQRVRIKIPDIFKKLSKTHVVMDSSGVKCGKYIRVDCGIVLTDRNGVCVFSHFFTYLNKNGEIVDIRKYYFDKDGNKVECACNERNRPYIRMEEL